MILLYHKDILYFSGLFLLFTVVFILT